MKKYIKPNLNIEELEIKEVIAALSVNDSKVLDTEADIYNWEDFWNQ